MSKRKVISVTPKKYFDIEIEVQEMENIHLSLYIDENGDVKPVDKSDMALVWQLKLMDKELWENTAKTVKDQI